MINTVGYILYMICNYLNVLCYTNSICLLEPQGETETEGAPQEATSKQLEFLLV